VNKGGDNLEPEDAYVMTCPEQNQYKDLHSDMIIPTITITIIESYLQSLGKKLGETDINMYKERFLSFVRVCDSNGRTYVYAVCQAEMKKSVSYKLDIILDRDGAIYECQCECAVGMGPSAHCKHVCACLYGLSQFCCGMSILTAETCTQKLQTFHAVKRHVGSPLKAKNLPLPYVTNSICFDPRPAKFRNVAGYSDKVRNLCTNFASSTGQSMSLLQLYSPANPYALSHDHDYFELTAEDHFLASYNITSISDYEVNNIEQRTRGQATNKSWLNERCFRLHASNYGRICKATERTDMKKLAASLAVTNEFTSAATDHGKRYEEPAIKKYCDLMSTVVTRSGIVVCKERPYLACSPDGLVGEDLLIEVKCPFKARNREVNSNSVPYLHKDENNNGYFLQIGHDYYYQIQGQMYITKRAKCHLVVYTLTDCLIVDVLFDNAFVEDMLQKLNEFFVHYFKPALLDRYVYKLYDDYSF
jgi:hypothetical protein